jgi:hypothetical protein
MAEPLNKRKQAKRVDFEDREILERILRVAIAGVVVAALALLVMW